MGSFSYGSGLWPSGMTLPTSGIGYSQTFQDSSGNLSNTSGMVYPIAVPRIDSGSTSGTTGNQHILPYSAQMFSAALSGIKTEYSERNATEPKFYAYFDASGTVKSEVSGYMDLLSMPLANFHYLIRDTYTAISGLVCMSGWNDDMVDYTRRVFDYRSLLRSVPSGNRLQDGVQYFNIASGTNVTINPLTRARAGQFPLNLDDIKHLGSKWGINPGGSRNYGSSEFSGSGVAVGERDARDPEFQQATFMGHFDWLVQSIMWRPPVTESFTKNIGASGAVANYERAEFGNTDQWEQESFPYLTQDSAPSGPNSTDADAVAEYIAPSSIIPGDYGYMRLCGPKMDRASVIYEPDTNSPDILYYLEKASDDDPVGFDVLGSTDNHYPRFFEEVTFENIGDALRVSMKDYVHTRPSSAGGSVSGIVYLSSTDLGLPFSYQDDSYSVHYGIVDRVSENGDGFTVSAIEDTTYSPSQQFNHDLNGTLYYHQQEASPSGYHKTHHPFQSNLTWVLPSLSGHFEKYGAVSGYALPSDDMAYPLGSGSKVLVDITIDSRNSASSSWTPLVGRGDWDGTHVCFQTNRHLPHGLVSSSGATDFPSYLQCDTKEVVYEEDEFFEEIATLGDRPSAEHYEIFSKLGPSDFDASGSIASGLNVVRTPPSLIQMYFTAGGHAPELIKSNGDIYNDTDRPKQAKLGTGGFGATASSVYSVYGDFPISWDLQFSDGDNPQNNSWETGVKNLSSSDYPSGCYFSTLKIQDSSPSGTVYEMDMWSKFQEDMQNMASHWPDARDTDGDAIASNVKNAVASSANASGATPAFGHIANNDEGIDLESISLVDLATAMDGQGLNASGVGYTLRSLTLKFPVILGPSGLQ